MENVYLQLKDPSATFSDSDQTLKLREVLSFPKTEKVRTALKTGVVRTVQLATASDENLDKVVVSEVESTTETKIEEVKPSKRK